MHPRSLTPLLALALTSACGEPLSVSDAESLHPLLARTTEVTVTWKLPLADAALAFRSDGRYSDGTYSVYSNGVCSVQTVIYSGSATSSGDATIRTSEPKGNRCGRLFTLSYPDGVSETVWSFANLHKLQNTEFSIPIGSTIRRRLAINPEVVTSPSRCGRLIFGPNDRTGAGTDSVSVTRVDSRTWHVSSEPAPNNRALCEATGEIFAMPVNFVLVTSQALP